MNSFILILQFCFCKNNKFETREKRAREKQYQKQFVPQEIYNPRSTISSEMISEVDFYSEISTVADPGFSFSWGGANSRSGYANLLFCNFLRKLHENERIWTTGGHIPATPLNPPMINVNEHKYYELACNSYWIINSKCSSNNRTILSPFCDLYFCERCTWDPLQ